MIGAATDYALLYVARFREALTHTTNRTAAALTAWKASWEPILASGATVIIALLCLLFSDLNSNKALGPVAAAGILCSLFAALTLLPALMALLGRAAFWPFRPKLLPETEREPELVTGLEGQKGLWRATGSLVSRRPRTVWVASVLLLLVAVRRRPAAQGQRRAADRRHPHRLQRRRRPGRPGPAFRRRIRQPRGDRRRRGEGRKQVLDRRSRRATASGTPTCWPTAASRSSPAHRPPRAPPPPPRCGTGRS